MRSVRAVWWCLLAPGLLAGGEHVVTDFVDGVVQMLEGFGDLLPGSVMRQGGAGSGSVSYTHLTLPTICSV